MKTQPRLPGLMPPRLDSDLGAGTSSRYFIEALSTSASWRSSRACSPSSAPGDEPGRRVRPPAREQAVGQAAVSRPAREAVVRIRAARGVAGGAAAELSDRYITGRFLPDKAIDLVDQASARVRLRSTIVPPDRRALEERLSVLERDKDSAAGDEDYEKASRLKGEIDRLRGQLDRGTGGPADVPEVTADDIAEVVSRASGIKETPTTENYTLSLYDLAHPH